MGGTTALTTTKSLLLRLKTGVFEVVLSDESVPDQWQTTFSGKSIPPYSLCSTYCQYFHTLYYHQKPFMPPGNMFHTTGNLHSKFTTFMCCSWSPSFTTRDLDRKISTLHLKIYAKLKHILTFCELEILTNAQPPTHSFTNAMVKNGF